MGRRRSESRRASRSINVPHACLAARKFECETLARDLQGVCRIETVAIGTVPTELPASIDRHGLVEAALVDADDPILFTPPQQGTIVSEEHLHPFALHAVVEGDHFLEKVLLPGPDPPAAVRLPTRPVVEHHR